MHKPTINDNTLISLTLLSLRLTLVFVFVPDVIHSTPLIGRGSATNYMRGVIYLCTYQVHIILITYMCSNVCVNLLSSLVQAYKSQSNYKKSNTKYKIQKFIQYKKFDVKKFVNNILKVIISG